MDTGGRGADPVRAARRPRHRQHRRPAHGGRARRPGPPLRTGPLPHQHRNRHRTGRLERTRRGHPRHLGRRTGRRPGGPGPHRMAPAGRGRDTRAAGGRCPGRVGGRGTRLRRGRPAGVRGGRRQRRPVRRTPGGAGGGTAPDGAARPRALPGHGRWGTAAGAHVVGRTGARHGRAVAPRVPDPDRRGHGGGQRRRRRGGAGARHRRGGPAHRVGGRTVHCGTVVHP